MRSRSAHVIPDAEAKLDSDAPIMARNMSQPTE